ncbi:UDP-glucose 4-epimerase GalE [Candidatus Woesearchaeota archaeon]|nr:UDP-glucose 4-epimerase GalE [Candidatus Woesearchaeota archaeon]
MAKLLVTGGAGYIGSHCVRELLKKGHNVVVYDSMINGHKESVPNGAVTVVADLADREKLDHTFKEHQFDAVIHFAAFIEAGESMKEPAKFYRNNVCNTLNLLESMRAAGVKKIIFSSTAALFGYPKRVPITEDEIKNPVNVYGRTKLMIEQMLQDFDMAYGIKHIALRYFNASGADFGIGEDHVPETHLIPLVLQVALGKRKEIKIFGTDYDTKDGTCIRDYIHVTDLVEAHILALDKLLSPGNSTIKSDCYNLGSGEGYSVKEVIDAARAVTGHPIPAVEADRRPGDPALLIADSAKIKKELGWAAKHDLKSIIKSAWEWHSKNPDGFNRGDSGGGDP